MMTTRDYRVVFILINIFISLLSTSFNTYALPEGEQVIAGSAAFDRSSSDTLNVSTPSDKLIVDYNSFSIAQTEAVNFNQPSASSIALNRVVGIDPSSIMGTLSANGRIFLVNPNGVVFGPDSRVDVAALVASTLDISNEDFLSGNYRFSKSGNNSYVINRGNIAVRNGGYVCLLSAAVENSGTIRAELGTVILASGEKITLALDDLNEISVVVDEAVKDAVFGPDGKRLDSAVKNTGTISANDGKVILTAKVLNNVFDYAINNSGIIEAKSLSNHNGVVELTAEGAPIINTGTLNANIVTINAINTDFINKGKIISDTLAATLSIKALNIINSGIISVPTSIILEAENAVIQVKASVLDQNSNNNQIPLAIIQSDQLNLKARQFGTLDTPLNIIGNNIYLTRTQGDIEILNSLGIGTSILLRGPPVGFGAIVYNRDTNLTLEAKAGGISASKGTTILTKDLSLIASRNIDIYGDISAASGSVNVESTDKGAINIYGTISAPNGTIRLWTSTTLDVGYSNLISKDGSFIWNPEDEVAVTWDSGAGTNDWEDANNWNPNGVPNNNSYRITLNKTGGSALTVNTDADYTIGALSIGTGGNRNVTLTLGGNLTIDDADPTVTGAGNLTIGTRGTIDANSYTISVDGNWSNSGTFTPGTGTVTFDGEDNEQDITSGGSSFYNLVIANTSDDTVYLQDDLDVDGNLTIEEDSTLDADGNAITIAGNWTNDDGTFNANENTVTFDGAGTSTISGSTTFFNFTSTTAGKQLTFTAGTTQTIEGDLTLTGAAGNLIVLRSSISGTQWDIDPQGSIDVSYVDVKDSNSTNSITANNSTNSGNNTNWTFSGTAAYLKITAASSTLTAGNSLELTITAYNAGGNIATTYTGAKNLTFSGLANAPSGTVPTVEGTNIGTATSINFTNGVSNAGVATLIAYKAESASLDVTDGTIDSTANASYDLDLTVNPAAASYFTLNAPADITAGTRAAYTVTRYDQYNNLVTSGAQTVYLYNNSTGANDKFYDAAAAGNVITQATISNTSSSANFWFYSEKSGSWTITASDATPAADGLTGIDDAQDSITVNPAVANYLKVTGTAAMTAGTTNELTITAYDQYGNTVNSGPNNYTGAKNLTFSGLANAPSGTVPTVEGTNIGTATSINFTNGVSNAGVATLIAYKAESASLDVTDGTIGSTGNATYDLDLTVNPGAANNLNFVQQPTNTLVNSTITPSVTVEVRDTWNNILTDDNTTNIAISIGTNPGTGTLSGTLTKTASGGQATFNDLSINKAGTGYALRVSSGALTSANSNAFDIALGAIILESQSSNSLILRILLPNSQQLLQYQINTFEPIGNVYLYHPLVEADISAFDAFILEEGAYEFIDGVINLSGHDALLNLLKQLKSLK